MQAAAIGVLAALAVVSHGIWGGVFVSINLLHCITINKFYRLKLSHKIQFLFHFHWCLYRHLCDLPGLFSEIYEFSLQAPVA